MTERTKDLKYNRIYVYTTEEVEDLEWTGSRKGKGLLKVGQTTDLSAENRVKAQLQGTPLTLSNNLYKILLDVEAVKVNGTYFRDSDVHKVLKSMGIKRIENTEWFECTLDEIKYALDILKSGGSPKNVSLKLKGTNTKKFNPVRNKEMTLERNC